MLNTLNIPVTGMTRAAAQAARAASDLVRGAGPSTGPPEATTLASGNRAYQAALARGAGGVGVADSLHPLGRGRVSIGGTPLPMAAIIDLKTAAHAYRANAAAFRALDPTLGGLLDTLK